MLVKRLIEYVLWLTADHHKLKYELHRLPEIPDSKIDSTVMADLLRQLEEGQTSVRNLNVLRDLVTPVIAMLVRPLSRRGQARL